jgi:uroporphyrinogen III methyltransferase/synthase
MGAPGRLTGISVAITRPPHQAGELRDLVEAEGGRPILFPTIEILPPAEWAGCDAAIDGLDGFDGVIFTSPNGVSNFIDRAVARGKAAARLCAKEIFAVGEATAKALSARGVAVTAMPERFTSADLAKTIGGGGIEGRRFLFPAGSLTPPAMADSLGRMGASVDTVVVYTTAAPAHDDVDAFYSMVRDGKVSWITFTSPSTVDNFAKIFTGGRAGTVRTMSRIAVIGPTTAHAAEEAGFRPDAVAQKSTAAGLVEAICVLVATRRPR